MPYFAHVKSLRSLWENSSDIPRNPRHPGTLHGLKYLFAATQSAIVRLSARKKFFLHSAWTFLSSVFLKAVVAVRVVVSVPQRMIKRRSYVKGSSERVLLFSGRYSPKPQSRYVSPRLETRLKLLSTIHRTALDVYTKVTPCLMDSVDCILRILSDDLLQVDAMTRLVLLLLWLYGDVAMRQDSFGKQTKKVRSKMSPSCLGQGLRYRKKSPGKQ